MVVDDGSSEMVIKALIVASKRAKEHKKRSPKSKDMAKTVFQKFQFFERAVVPLRDGDFAREREFSGFWAEKRPENGQIGGEIDGIRPWERKGSKINKFSNRSTDQNLPKRTRFTDRSKSNLGLFFVEIFEFLKIIEKFGGGNTNQSVATML